MIPSAVNGRKDAMTSDGKIQPQSVNLAPVVSVLAKAVQEQHTQTARELKVIREENAALKAQIAAQAALIGQS